MVITSVLGAAAGAGANLALSGDFVICAENVKFMQAFINLGLVPDTGGTYLLSKTIGPARAMELCATGRPLTAAEANYADYGRYLAESEAPTQSVCIASEDFKEGVRAFIEKEKPNFKGE